MISTLHTAEIIETISRRMGVAKKKPKCIIDYNTHMHSVDTADQYLAHYPFIRKTVKWPKKVQGGSNMTGTDLCVNKPQCAATVRP